MTDLTPASSRISIGFLLATSVRKYSAVWLLAFFVILFSITAPETFPTALTLKIVLTNQVTVGLIALALLVPLCGGTFDLSVGAMLAFSMVMTATLLTHGVSVSAAGGVALLGCAVVGVINGFIIVKLHVNSFIATLGSSQLLLAATLFISKNRQVTPKEVPAWFAALSSESFLGINYDVYILFGVALVLWYALEHTPIGRSLFATGGNPEAARLAGVGTDGLIWLSMVVSALIAGLAGILLLSQVGYFTQEYGPGFLFPGFAAVFFGATQIKGRPNVWGTLLALYALAAAVAGLQLTFFGNEYWIDPLFNGAALLIAVSFASREHLGKAYRKLRHGSSGSPDESRLQADDRAAVPAARQVGA